MTDTNTNTAEAEVEAKATESKPAARQRAPKDASYFAILEKGANYAANIKGKIYRFKNGVKVGPISEEVKNHLEETAVDMITITDGEGEATTEGRAKFKFEKA